MAKHILVVDDEPRVAFFLSKALEHDDLNYRVSVAHSGEEALEILNRSPVDLLVTDLRMPGISGLELMRWVRASSPKTRTILITAYGNDEVEAEARHLQAYRYITKPFSLDDFTQVAEEALRDVAISQPGLVVLSDESFDAITQQLERLRQDVGARCILLADMLGQRLAEVGITGGLDTAALLSLLAGGFATTGELARQFGSGQAVNLNFHEGSRYEIYSASVGENLFMAMLYDRKVQTSRIGIVWLYTRRAIDQLKSTLSTAPAAEPTQSLDADFGPSLMAELDTLFPGPPQQAGPLPQREPRPPERSRAGAADPLPSDTLDRLDLGPPIASKAESSRSGSTPDTGDTRPPDEDLAGERLLTLKDAIAQGLIPPDLGLEYTKRS